jgi:hypothetical protein
LRMGVTRLSVRFRAGVAYWPETAFAKGLRAEPASAGAGGSF